MHPASFSKQNEMQLADQMRQSRFCGRFMTPTRGNHDADSALLIAARSLFSRVARLHAVGRGFTSRKLKSQVMNRIVLKMADHFTAIAA